MFCTKNRKIFVQNGFLATEVRPTTSLSRLTSQYGWTWHRDSWQAREISPQINHQCFGVLIGWKKVETNKQPFVLLNYLSKRTRFFFNVLKTTKTDPIVLGLTGNEPTTKRFTIDWKPFCEGTLQNIFIWFGYSVPFKGIKTTMSEAFMNAS